MEEELRKMRDKIDELEKAYYLINDYKLIITILDKLELKEIKLTDKEIEENKSMYIVHRDYDNGKVTVTKRND